MNNSNKTSHTSGRGDFSRPSGDPGSSANRVSKGGAGHLLPVMSPDEHIILGNIQRQRGRNHALPANYFAKRLEINPRKLRRIIRRLRIIFHHPICSTTGQPSGYYWAITREEIYEAYKTWFDFGIKQLVMARSLLNFTPDELLDQVSLALQDTNQTSGTDIPVCHTRKDCHSRAGGNPEP